MFGVNKQSKVQAPSVSSPPKNQTLPDKRVCRKLHKVHVFTAVRLSFRGKMYERFAQCRLVLESRPGFDPATSQSPKQLFQHARHCRPLFFSGQRVYQASSASTYCSQSYVSDSSHSRGTLTLVFVFIYRIQVQRCINRWRSRHLRCLFLERARQDAAESSRYAPSKYI